MKKVLIAVAALAAACGGSSGSSSSNGSTTAQGTLAGAAFQPSESVGFIVQPTSCTIGTETTALAMAGVMFTNAQGTCSFMQEHPCDDKKGATGVTVAIVRGGAAGANVAIGAGTYAVTTALPTPDANGVITSVFAGAGKNDDSCHDAMESVTGTSGTVKIDQVTPTLKGSVDLTFSDGSKFSGSFDAASCARNLDACAETSTNTCSGHAPVCL
jgi:hypothetical protein